MAAIYDFGGHEVYRTIQHFFMDDWAVYLIVVKLTDSMEEIRKQLSHYISVVRTNAPNSKLFLIGTHRYQCQDLDARRGRLQEYLKDLHVSNVVTPNSERALYETENDRRFFQSKYDMPKLKKDLRKGILDLMEEDVSSK